MARVNASEAVGPIEVAPEFGAWIETTLGQLADYINGFAFKPTDWHEQGLPIIRIGQLTDPKAQFDRYPGRLPERYLIRDGDLIFSWSATLMTLIWDRGPAYLNQHLFRVVARSGTNLEFLHHLLDFKMDALAGQTHGTTMRHIKRSDLLPFRVSVPTETEQRSIASVLDAADDAIHKTEELLAKLGRVKQGVLHSLLTRGVEDTGVSRDPGRSPAQFNETPLGLLPRAWNVLTVTTLVDSAGTFIQTGPFGSQLHASDYVSAGVPVVMPQDILNGEIATTRVARIREEKARALGRHRMQAGDIVFARRGDLSKCATIKEDQEGWLCGTGCLLLRPPQTAVRSSWLAAVYRHDLCQRQIAAAAVGSTMVNLNSTLLGALRIPLPPTTEQDQIGAVIDADQQRTDLLRLELTKLRLIKRGLMRDLLTRRVRAPLAPEAVLARTSVSA